MTGKTIKAAIEMENGYKTLVFSDNTATVVKVVGDLDLEAMQEALESEEEEEEKEEPKKGGKKAKAEEKPAGKKGKKKEEPEEEEEEDDEESEEEEEEVEITGEDLMEMDEEELTDLVEEQEMDIDTDEYDNADALRKAIAKELGIELPKKDKKKKK